MKDDVRRDDTILPIVCSLWPELAGCRCLLHFHHGTARSADDRAVSHSLAGDPRTDLSDSWCPEEHCENLRPARVTEGVRAGSLRRWRRNWRGRVRLSPN
jgi:hypothetical protein